VGGGPASPCVPRCTDADRVAAWVMGDAGWLRVDGPAGTNTVTLPPGTPVWIAAQYVNSGQSTWRHEGSGRVELVCRAPGEVACSASLANDVSPQAVAHVEPFVAAVATDEALELRLQLAVRRSGTDEVFGSSFRIRVEPD